MVKQAVLAEKLGVHSFAVVMRGLDDMVPSTEHRMGAEVHSGTENSAVKDCCQDNEDSQSPWARQNS